MGCQGNELIVPSPRVDFTSNNQILKYQCPYYKNMWVYKNPTRGGDFTFCSMDYRTRVVAAKLKPLHVYPLGYRALNTGLCSSTFNLLTQYEFAIQEFRLMLNVIFGFSFGRVK